MSHGASGGRGRDANRGPKSRGEISAAFAGMAMRRIRGVDSDATVSGEGRLPL